MVKKYITNVYKVLKESLPSALSSVLFLLTALGLFVRPWDKSRFWRDGYFMAYIVFFWFGVMPMFHLLERHYLPLLPIIFIWASGGATQWLVWSRQTLQNLSVCKALTLSWVLLILFWGLGQFLPELGRIVSKTPADADYWGAPVEQKVAGLWLRSRLNPGEGIMSRDAYRGLLRRQHRYPAIGGHPP